MHTIMKAVLAGTFTALAAASPAQAGPPAAQELAALSAEDRELIDLNRRLTHSMIVQADPTLFSQVALENFRVVAPGGLIENKSQVAGSLGSWENIKGIQLSGEEVVRHGPVAILTGRLDIDGEVRPVGRWGPLKLMSVFVREDGQWRLLSRALTPCHDLLIKRGRC